MFQLEEIWATVQLKAVWKPMMFVFLYNLSQVPNVAWNSYIQLTLGFPPWILGVTLVLGSLMTFTGVLAYKRYFFGSSWRSIYSWSTLLTSFFSLLQLVLIFQLNQYIGLSNYFFAVGDDVITAYISGTSFLLPIYMYIINYIHTLTHLLQVYNFYLSASCTHVFVRKEVKALLMQCYQHLET